ncbi:helicase [Vulcanimicrobium alpinum]|uniref:Helicase n=1 Tax=Vulcanimicrobium alpinum TaxID=3016050 RepID=A0AAN1XXI2_UNVUL|nr:DEAD/DEAH box helicase [Vulcanimicrobium alpinum]BDE07216.1 helicase [Vulcanimicrobium alpinum]
MRPQSPRAEVDAHDPFRSLHPDIAAWCDERLREPTPPQAQALPLAATGRHALICSPTGTGKTLSAFLPVMSRLADLRDADELLARTYCLYVSPLRALGYDVEHNVRRPLREMGLLERPNTERARVRRGRVRERFVRTGVRTGDTPQEERRLMLARPPHILMTTPESLALMVAMDSYRKTLSHVETVIVDEVHALAGSKRGAHLTLLLESLDLLSRSAVRRVGLSATVAPLDRVASFLAGTGRECAVVDCRGLRQITLDITAPFAGAMATLATCARTAYTMTRDVRSTLVFTNVRSQAERVAHEMELAGEPAGVIEVADDVPRATTEKRDRRIGVHHSALEKNIRHRTEADLRSGTLRTVVCSSSLELGVDIGYIDRVIVMGGARGMTPTLQRVGRSGHRPGAVAAGTILAQDRDDIIEAAATRRCIREGIIEEVAIPEAPLDVLAQWVVGQCVPDRRVPFADVLATARQAYPFRDLRDDDLRACVAYLTGGGAGLDDAHVRRIGTDGEALYGLGREPSSAYFENVGTIPDESTVPVSGAGGSAIGRLGEGFAATLSPGDVFLLEGRTLRVTESGPRGLRVEPYAGRPTVPQWSSHLKGVPLILAHEIGRLRRGVADALAAGGAQGALAYVRGRYGLDGAEAAHVVRYVAQQVALSALPDGTHPVIELYRMDQRQTAVYHTCAGRRVNETLARVVGARLHREARVNSTLTTDDNGFLVALPARKRVPDSVWPSLLRVDGFERDLVDGLRASNLLRQQFRHVANTGLLVLRRAGGRSIRGGALRWNAAKIFDRLWEADRDFPLVRETLRTVTRDLLDAPAALRYLEGIEGEPRVLHPAAATPFTFGIVTSSFGDSVVMDDRASMVEALHERVLALLGERVETAPVEDARPGQMRLL